MTTAKREAPPSSRKHAVSTWDLPGSAGTQISRLRILIFLSANHPTLTQDKQGAGSPFFSAFFFKSPGFGRFESLGLGFPFSSVPFPLPFELPAPPAAS